MGMIVLYVNIKIRKIMEKLDPILDDSTKVLGNYPTSLKTQIFIVPEPVKDLGFQLRDFKISISSTSSSLRCTLVFRFPY